MGNLLSSITAGVSTSVDVTSAQYADLVNNLTASATAPLRMMLIDQDGLTDAEAVTVTSISNWGSACSTCFTLNFAAAPVNAWAGDNSTSATIQSGSIATAADGAVYTQVTVEFENAWEG